MTIENKYTIIDAIQYRLSDKKEELYKKTRDKNNKQYEVDQLTQQLLALQMEITFLELELKKQKGVVE